MIDRKKDSELSLPSSLLTDPVCTCLQGHVSKYLVILYYNLPCKITTVAMYSYPCVAKNVIHLKIPYPCIEELLNKLHGNYNIIAIQN